MDTIKKFTGKADVYKQFRPNYPEEYIQYLIRENHLTPQSQVADIGSGTGKLTAQLLDHHLKVIAVEPNDDMRNAAEQNLSRCPTFTSQNGTAENTWIQAKSIDLITVAQAFHWFEVEKFKTECQRILKPGAKVALVWNSRNQEQDLIQENALIHKKYCPTFKGFSGGIAATAKTTFPLFFKNGNYQEEIFQNDLYYTLEGFIGRNQSSSYAPNPQDPHYAAYIQEITALFEKYSANGILTMPNLTRSFLGEV